MSDKHLYYESDVKKKDEMGALPDEVKAALAAHLELYKTDPEAAHHWDTANIGLEGVVPCLMLTATGAKSGKIRQNCLQYYRVDNNYVVIASRGGTVDHPVWYKNLLANPECEIQVGGFHSRARARTITGPDRERYWKAVTEEQPIQIEYQKKTSRQIPVVVMDLID